jgi:hypothetical protein
MQTVTTLPVLQAVSDSTDHYLGLQPIIKGRTNAEYVNSNLRFNPSSNTLTLNANLNLRRGVINSAAIANSSITPEKLAPVTRIVEQFQTILTHGGNTTLNLLESSVYYLDSNTRSNITFNLTGSGSIRLDNVLNPGQSITSTVILPQGAIAYIANVSIDGVYQTGTTRWLGNTAPRFATLARDQIDVYTMTALKTAPNTFLVLAAVSTYGRGA